MTLSLGMKGRCILAWAAALLIPLALITAVAWPWANRLGELERDIAAREEQILRYRGLIATLPALRAELERVRSNEDVRAFYFDAPTPALAGAQLQRELQQIVKAAGARLVSTQILPSVDDERPQKVRVRTQMQGETDALLEVLFRIEQARPFLFVDQLSVRSTSRRVVRRSSRLRGRRAVRQDTGKLTVRLDIFGYALGEGR